MTSTDQCSEMMAGGQRSSLGFPWSYHGTLNEYQTVVPASGGVRPERPGPPRANMWGLCLAHPALSLLAPRTSNFSLDAEMTPLQKRMLIQPPGRRQYGLMVSGTIWRAKC